MEAWLMNMFRNEKGLGGLAGGVSNKAYKDSLDNLEISLRSNTSQRTDSYYNQVLVRSYAQKSTVQQGTWQQSQIPQSQMQHPTYQIPMDLPRENPTLFNSTSVSTAILIYGIISLCLAFIIPIFGAIFGCIG